MKELLHNALNNPTSKAIKVFLHAYDQKDKYSKRPLADGMVRFNKSFLELHKQEFKDWIIENIPIPHGVVPYFDFASYTDWTDNIDDALMMLGALEVLGFGKVVGNTPKEEMLKAKGFNSFPMFKFNE